MVHITGDFYNLDKTLLDINSFQESMEQENLVVSLSLSLNDLIH